MSVGASDRAALELLDGQGEPRADFEPGDSLLVAVRGLRPARTHRVTVFAREHREILRTSLVSDRFGVIAPTAVWPDIGIGDPNGGGEFAFATSEDALASMAAETFVVEVRDRRRVVGRSEFAISEELVRPRLYSASEAGAPLRGLLVHEDDLRVQGRNLPPGSLLDVYLVARQADWRPGDAIVPIENPDGSEVVSTVELEQEEPHFNVVLWPRELTRPGSYDVLARATREHEFRRWERVLRPSDLVSDRLVTGVVVRQEASEYKPIQLGCVMAQDVAGKRLTGSPYFAFTDNFPRGTDVWAALDPAALPQARIGKKVRYYVVDHKDAAQWTADSSAVDVTGNSSEVVVAPGCINANEALVWPNPQRTGRYDLLVDFGNQASDPKNFVADDSFDPPDDMIDGYVRVGFHVTEDPSLPGPFPVGQTSFNEPAVEIPAVGVWRPSGPPAGGTPTGTLSLPLIADARYPVDPKTGEVSPLRTRYPVVVVMHGNAPTSIASYLGYDYLLSHLASHGYIAVSIDCNAINAIDGMQDTRAHAILEHLGLLSARDEYPGLFEDRIALSSIALLGHSRGGDGVVQAEILNQGFVSPWSIRAIIALAPTDFSGLSPAPTRLRTSKFLCIYGSNDGDVAGMQPAAGGGISGSYMGTGFRHYDRAEIEKAMVFVYGATHNRFNRLWGTEWFVDASSPKILSATQHERLLCGYVTAFLQAQVEGRSEQLGYFTGELKLPAVSTVEVHTQYRPETSLRRPVDDFESAPAVSQNSLGGTVAQTALNPAPQEGPLGVLDLNSPHQTRGLRLGWRGAPATYVSGIPVAGPPADPAPRDVRRFRFLSFRVTQIAGSPANLPAQLQDLHVRLTGGGRSRSVRAGFFATVPYPYKPEYAWNNPVDRAKYEREATKSALKTVRIPLHAWTIKALTAPIVDLSQIESIGFEFAATASGELEIDDVEFTT